MPELMPELMQAGFMYQVTVIRKDGSVEVDPPVHNIIPTEGLNHIVGVAFKSVTPVADWSVGLFTNNYTPIAGDTSATFPGNAGESTAYTSATRMALTLGAVDTGQVNNEASVTEFAINASVTVYGGFISSNNAKSSTTGTLISASKFSSSKILVDGDVLRVRAGFILTSS